MQVFAPLPPVEYFPLCFLLTILLSNYFPKYPLQKWNFGQLTSNRFFFFVHHGVDLCLYYKNMGWQSKILIKSLRRLTLFLIVNMTLKKCYFWRAGYDLKSCNKTSPNFWPMNWMLNKILGQLLSIYQLTQENYTILKHEYIKRFIFSPK